MLFSGKDDSDSFVRLLNIISGGLSTQNQYSSKSIVTLL